MQVKEMSILIKLTPTFIRVTITNFVLINQTCCVNTDKFLGWEHVYCKKIVVLRHQQYQILISCFEFCAMHSRERRNDDTCIFQENAC